MDRNLAKPGALLAPDFAVTVAQAVLTRAPHMAEKDLVDALNKCQSMAAKAQLLSHKGVARHESSIDLARKFLEEKLDDNLEPVSDEEEPDGKEEGDEPPRRAVPPAPAGPGV